MHYTALKLTTNSVESHFKSSQSLMGNMRKISELKKGPKIVYKAEFKILSLEKMLIMMLSM